ncbi:MAG: hypothetical protein WC620_06010 [Methanoregula sp.]
MAVYATINPIVTPTTVPPVQNGAFYMSGNYYGYSPLTIPNLPPGTYNPPQHGNGLCEIQPQRCKCIR